MCVCIFFLYLLHILTCPKLGKESVTAVSLEQSSMCCNGRRYDPGCAVRPKTKPDLMRPAAQSTPPFLFISHSLDPSIPEFSVTCKTVARAFFEAC